MQVEVESWSDKLTILDGIPDLAQTVRDDEAELKEVKAEKRAIRQLIDQNTASGNPVLIDSAIQ